MSPAVNIVVTCTDRKKAPVNRRLRLRSVRTADIQKRAEHWVGSLETTDSVQVPARDLYAGVHWSVVRELSDASREGGLSSRVWVVSAGYGLVEIDSPLKPYSATFARGHEDSICRTPGASFAPSRAWWKALSKWSVPGQRLPRTLTALAKREPASILLVVGSTPYLEALKEDLEAATAKLRRPE